MQTRNSILRKYFADILGVPAQTYGINKTIRLALNKLGYEGSLNRMLFDFWKDRGGTGSNLNSVFRTALIAMGGTGNSLNTLMDVLSTADLTWVNWAVDYEAETRNWENIK